MKDFELPALEYYSLERAARFIGSGCETGDLLHWAEIGAINLAKKFDGGDVHSIIFDCDVMQLSKYLYDRNLTKDYYINFSKHSILSTNNLIDCESLDDVVAVLTKRTDYPRLSGYLYGVWEIIDFSIDKKRKNEVVINKLSSMGEDSPFKLLAMRPVEEHEYDGELLVPKQSVEKILGRKINSLESVGISKKSPADEEAGDRVIYNRAALIKALIAVHYGEDLSNKPRAFFDNPNSEIRKDFESKGIKLPSGKTIEQWLKDVEIDFY